MLPRWLCRILITTGLLHQLTKFFRLSAKTTTEVINGITDNKELRAVLSYCFLNYGRRFYSKQADEAVIVYHCLGVLPTESPWTSTAMIWNQFSQGAAYPVGGASEIAFQLIRSIQNVGGEVLVRAIVKRILTTPAGSVCGTKVTREKANFSVWFSANFSGVLAEKGGIEYEVKAPVIISNAGLINTFTELLPREVANKSSMLPFQCLFFTTS